MRTAVQIGRSAINRRNFLYAATAAVGVAGTVVGTWPLIDQMNPDARTRAGDDVMEIDLVALRAAEQRVVLWRNFPIFLVRRTAAMLGAMQDKTFVARLYDPNSHTRQQPSYAQNWHRSIDPALAVLVGVCTKCAVVPAYCSDTSSLCMAGDYICPFCASRYDPAGRAYSGITSYNLPVPPYSFVTKSKIALGKNAAHELFSLESIVQI
jgi:ubiquinol-cytochrome c reductase iron-sulfur subunit